MAGVKGKSGRRPKTEDRARAEKIYAESAHAIARRIIDYALGQQKLSEGELKACFYAQDRSLGRPNIQIDQRIRALVSNPADYIARIETVKELDKEAELKLIAEFAGSNIEGDVGGEE